jgi:bifunctional non-homologous end joining protein LigD
VRLITRHGNDFTHRFPLAGAAISALPGRSLLIDGEAIVTNSDGQTSLTGAQNIFPALGTPGEF